MTTAINADIGAQRNLTKASTALKKYVSAQHSHATMRAYASDFRIFDAWCRDHSLASLPATAESVALFVCDQGESGCNASTLHRRLSAIRLAHVLKELEPPTNSEAVKAAMRGVRRLNGLPPQSKTPLLADAIRRIAEIPDQSTLAGLRDRALLLLGFSGAFRRSELVRIQVSDIKETSKGLLIALPRSKTDQEGKGHSVPILRGGKCCPVDAVNKWLQSSGIKRGPVFRRVRRHGIIGNRALSPYAVVLIIKKYTEKAGLNKTEYSGISLRSGFITSAAMNGADIFKILAVSRHKSINSLMAYIKPITDFDNHAAKGMLD